MHRKQNVCTASTVWGSTSVRAGWCATSDRVSGPPAARSPPPPSCHPSCTRSTVHRQPKHHGKESGAARPSKAKQDPELNGQPTPRVSRERIKGAESGSDLHIRIKKAHRRARKQSDWDASCGWKDLVEEWHGQHEIQNGTAGTLRMCNRWHVEWHRMLSGTAC